MSTPSFRRSLRRAPLWLAMLVAVPAMAQSVAPGYEAPRAAVYRADAGRVLGPAVAAAERSQAVAAALRARGRDAATVAALREAGAVAGRNGFTHVRLEQNVEGLAVYGTYAKAAFDRNGQLVHLIDQLARVPAGTLPAASVDARQALQAAMARVHPAVAASFTPAGAAGVNRLEFDGGAFFHGRPSVEAVAVPLADGSMARGWLVQTWTQHSNQLHHTLVSGDGRVLFVESRTARDSYNVFPIDPGKGAQTVVVGPGTGNTESPIGWLGSGTQSTINIAGNNVNAYLDASNNNKPDRGGTAVTDGNFLTAAVLTQSPATSANMAVAVQNLFFHNNVIHDRLYRHGFTELAGNFQNDNFGLGGKGRDAVNAEAQDGSGTDNANFATPPDGQKPRMQMYLWTGPGATHEVAVSGGASYGGAGSAFGPAFTTTGVSGALTPTTPADGCTAIATALTGRIALIDRGACEFTAKVLNAQAAGAAAVVIANNDQGNPNGFFGPGAGTGAKRVRIPSLMVSYSSGLALKALGSPTATARMLAVQPLQLDASLDSDIVYHEYCHGLTWRMIGGMSGPVAGAIGEGMSDGCSMLINGDDKVGEYSASNPNGIRRFPYAGYPLTYANVNGAEVHDDGEIYAAIVWSLITRFDAAYPGTGRDRLFGYLVDGMNFTPATPMFEDMRSGILQAVGGTPGSADRCHVWRAFAQFGVGEGSSAVINNSTLVTTTPSFTRGEGCGP